MADQPRRRVAVFGHSLVLRLATDISEMVPGLLPGFDLLQCDVRCRGVGGLIVTDKHVTFLQRFTPFLRTFSPHVVILELGGNDMYNGDYTPARCLELASSFDDLGTRLSLDIGADNVLVCERFTRKFPSRTIPEQYEDNRIAVLGYLNTFLEQSPGVRLWRHRRIFGCLTPIYLDDGIHLNDVGQLRFYGSIRLAIMTGIRI